MATFDIDDKTARAIYAEAPPAFKAIMEKNFPVDFFVDDIIDQIKSFEDACKYNNTNPQSARFIYGTINQVYQERVAEFVKALNQGWVADYDVADEEKFVPIFLLNAPGFRFCDSYYVVARALTACGSRFAFKNRKLSDYAGQHFVEEYKKWLMPCDESFLFDEAIVVSANKDFSGDIAAWEAYIIPRVGSFEAACREADITPTDPRFGFGTPDEIAYRKGKLVCDVMNAPFMDKMKDKTSRKWSAWMEKTETGFRFIGSHCGFTYANAAGGSRLRLCSEKLAKHFGETFADMMAPYWWNE